MSEALFRRIYDTIGLTSHKLGGVAFDDLSPEEHETFARSVAAAVTGELFEHPRPLMPCGHDVENLIGGKGAVTKCGQCLADRQSLSALAYPEIVSKEPWVGEVAKTLAPVRTAAESILGTVQRLVRARVEWENSDGRVRVEWKGNDPAKFGAKPNDREDLRALEGLPIGEVLPKLCQLYNEAKPAPAPAPARRGVYIASKTKHAQAWKDLRASGLPVISSWIDVPQDAETTDDNYHVLWGRNIAEAARAVVLLAYHEDGEIPKGALAEIGAALAGGAQVYWVGPSTGQTVVDHERVCEVDSLEEALELVRWRLAEAAEALPSIGDLGAPAAGFAEGRAEERAALLLLVQTQRKGATGAAALALDTLEMVLERELGAAIALASARAAGAAEERNRAEAEISTLRTKLASTEELCSAYKNKWIATMKWLGMTEPGDFDVKGKIEQLQHDAEGVAAARARWKIDTAARAEKIAADQIWSGADWVHVAHERIPWKGDPAMAATLMRAWLVRTIHRIIAPT